MKVTKLVINQIGKYWINNADTVDWYYDLEKDYSGLPLYKVNQAELVLKQYYQTHKMLYNINREYYLLDNK